MSNRQTALLLALPALLSACAGLPEDRGRGDVAALVNSRGRDTAPGDSKEQVAQLVRELSAKPLAVKIASRVAADPNFGKPVRRGRPPSLEKPRYTPKRDPHAGHKGHN